MSSFLRNILTNFYQMYRYFPEQLKISTSEAAADLQFHPRQFRQTEEFRIDQNLCFLNVLVYRFSLTAYWTKLLRDKNQNTYEELYTNPNCLLRASDTLKKRMPTSLCTKQKIRGAFERSVCSIVTQREVQKAAET